MQSALRPQNVPPRLRRQMLLAGGLLLCMWLLSVCLGWSYLCTHPESVYGFLPGLAVALYLLYQLKHNLGANHRRGEAPHIFDTLGAANWISLLRAGATVGLAGFLPLAIQSDHPLPVFVNWAPGSIYLGISMADLFDGYMARIQQRETELGKRLDIEADAAGLLVASLVAVALGRLPVIYLLVGMVYYPYILGIWIRRKRALAVTTLKQRPYARITAGFQMGLVGMALLPVWNSDFTTVAAWIFMIPLLTGFVRDWWVVAGWIKTDADQRSALDNWARTWVFQVTPLVLRLIILGGGIVTLFSFGIYRIHPFWQTAHSFFCLSAGFGCMGRSASLGLLLLLAGTSSPFGTYPLSMVIYAAAAALMLVGTGAISIWAPEDPILYRCRQNGSMPHCEVPCPWHNLR
ncbi:MAG: CDP-alcohol phosphatidyltransferase family protein [Desulfobacteraceae bacterium]